MRQPNEIYLSGNNSTAQVTSAHETSILQLFNSPEFGEIRAITINNEPYFVGNDVAKILGYARPSDAISQHVDMEDAVKHRISDNQGVPHDYIIINESGLYSLIFGSKLPTAKSFKRWVTSEVLPIIRKTGTYQVNNAPGKQRTPSLTTKVKASLLWIEGLSKSLNLNDASKLAMFKQVAY